MNPKAVNCSLRENVIAFGCKGDEKYSQDEQSFAQQMGNKVLNLVDHETIRGVCIRIHVFKKQ